MVHLTMLRTALSLLLVATPMCVLGQRSEQERLLELAVNQLSSKISQPLPPKGIPFPSIPGPRCKADRIGVVGAGPSGTHMAYLLKQAGYDNVVIMEKENRIGGKSVAVESKGSTYSLTTYLLTADYLENVYALMEEFGILDLAPAEAIYLSRDDHRAQGFSRIALQAMSMFSPQKFLQDVEKYIDLHRQLFGTYEAELMSRPDGRTLSLLRGSLQDYLLRNNMESMVPFLNLAMRQPGYEYA